MSNTLKEFWTFDDADLAANRNGQLSERQKALLVGEHATQRKAFFGVGGVMAVILLCVPVLVIGTRLVIPAILSRDFQLQNLLPVGIGMGTVLSILIPLILVIGLYLLRANKQADLSIQRTAGKAVYSTGTKRVRNPGNSAKPYEDVRVLYLSLGDKKFEVPNDLKEIIREGEEWIIYYTSYPFKFLSGEGMNK
jgi:hypothetical protein